MILKRIKNLIRNVNYLSKHSLWDDKEELIVYLTNKILDDASFEYNLDSPETKKLNILDTDETLDLIEKSNKSFVRTGDGEIKAMMCEDHAFQKYEKEVADRLINLLEQPRDNILVGINRNYFISLKQVEDNWYYRRNAYEFRNFYQKYCNVNNLYIDACCTGDRYKFNDAMTIKKIYERWRSLFKGRNLAIVCGEGVLDSLEYDVFELANSKEYIYGPKTNAWDKHDEIINKITDNVSKDRILVFILGQAGKAMIPELTDMGYICWDVGHLAKYYNAYMTNMEWNKENTSKFYAPE